MSGVSIVNYLLSNTAAVTALVPAASIVSGVVPMDSALPAVGVKQVSGVERLDVPMTGSRYISERVQVTAYTSSYGAKEAILRAARNACVGQRGTVNGFKLDSILPDGEGPDLDDDATRIFERSIDLIVRWNTA